MEKTHIDPNDAATASGCFGILDDMLIIDNIISGHIFNKDHVTPESLRALKALGDTCRRMRCITSDKSLWEDVDFGQIAAFLDSTMSTHRSVFNPNVFRNWTRHCRFVSTTSIRCDSTFSLPDIMPKLQYVVHYSNSTRSPMIKHKPGVTYFHLKPNHGDFMLGDPIAMPLAVPDAPDSRLVQWFTAVSKTLPTIHCTTPAFDITVDVLAVLIKAMRFCMGSPKLECLAAGIIDRAVQNISRSTLGGSMCISELHAGVTSPNVTHAFKLMAARVIGWAYSSGSISTKDFSDVWAPIFESASAASRPPGFAVSVLDAMMPRFVMCDRGMRVPTGEYRLNFISLFEMALTESAESASTMLRTFAASQIVSFLPALDERSHTLVNILMAINKHKCEFADAYAVLALHLSHLVASRFMPTFHESDRALATVSAVILMIASSIESKLLQQPPNLFAVLALCDNASHAEAVRPGITELMRRVCSQAAQNAIDSYSAFCDLQELTDWVGKPLRRGAANTHRALMTLDLVPGLLEILGVRTRWAAGMAPSAYARTFGWVYDLLSSSAQQDLPHMIQCINELVTPLTSAHCVLIGEIYALDPTRLMSTGIEAKVANECITRGDVNGLIGLIKLTMDPHHGHGLWISLYEACLVTIDDHTCVRPECPRCMVERAIRDGFATPTPM